MGNLSLGFKLLPFFYTKVRGVGVGVFSFWAIAQHLYAHVLSEVMVLETGDFRHISRKQFNNLNAIVGGTAQYPGFYLVNHKFVRMYSMYPSCQRSHCDGELTARLSPKVRAPLSLL